MDQPVTKGVTNARSRLVCFTMFDMNVDLQAFASQFTYMAVGRETCPTTGKEHFQGFAYTTTAQRFPWWRKRLSPHHFEFCFGNLQQNEKYCSKQGNYQEFGEKPMGDGKRRDLIYVCDAIIKKRKIEEVALEVPNVFVQYHNGLSKLAAIAAEPYQHETVRGVWIYGPPGTGKTSYARSTYPDIYIKSQTKWFDGYSGQATIVLDDLDSPVLGHYLKIWMDMWACTGEIKGGTVHLRHHHFVVTSNKSIDELFSDATLVAAITRRCKVIYMPFKYPGTI